MCDGEVGDVAQFEWWLKLLDSLLTGGNNHRFEITETSSVAAFLSLIRTLTISNSTTRNTFFLFPSINGSSRKTSCHNQLSFAKRNPSLSCRRADWKIAAIEDVSAAVRDPAPAVLTWQSVVGAIAGVTPFVVAGTEFSKRIIAQKRCQVCGRSGLVLTTKQGYRKCPGCGGFLPWQSWKRFFTG